MKTDAALILGLAAVAVLAAVGVHAQEIDTYPGPGFNSGYHDGDLVLVFFSATDTANNAPGDLLFNLGPASSFTGLAGGTYSVAGFNGSNVAGQGHPGFGNADLTGYPAGSLTVPNSSTFWTVMGGNSNGANSVGVADQLWLTGTGAQQRLSASSQGTIAYWIDTIGYAGIGTTNPDGSGADSSQTTGNYLLVDGYWADTSAVADNTVSATSNSLDLYSMVPGTGGAGSSTLLGTFKLTDTDGVYSLTFTVPPGQGSGPGSTSRLVNISSRASVGTGANLEIAGFVVSGPPGSMEKVLVRGVGPTLSQFGVGGVLANPVLTLYDSAGSQLNTNTGWSTAPNASEISAAATTTGAFALSSGSADSAMLVNLAPGAYTAEITGAAGTTGVALAEVYEVSSGTAELINISTRAFVGTQSNVEIGGFVVRGPQPETVLVRAVGPALSQFGVSGVLAQPSLSVVDSSGNTVATNTGWSNNANAANIASETAAVGAFTLASGSADSALLLTLPPGAYTAVVSGVGSTSGIALAEVYKVP